MIPGIIKSKSGETVCDDGLVGGTDGLFRLEPSLKRSLLVPIALGGGVMTVIRLIRVLQTHIRQPRELNMIRQKRLLCSTNHLAEEFDRGVRVLDKHLCSETQLVPHQGQVHGVDALPAVRRTALERLHTPQAALSTRRNCSDTIFADVNDVVLQKKHNKARRINTENTNTKYGTHGIRPHPPTPPHPRMLLLSSF